MPLHEVLLAVGCAALAIFASRALPFIALTRHQHLGWLQYVGNRLPAAIMVILVVYSLQGLTLFNTQSHTLEGGIHGWPLLAASLFVALLHIWKRNTLLSIFVGTGFYMLLIQSGF